MLSRPAACVCVYKTSCHKHTLLTLKPEKTVGDQRLVRRLEGQVGGVYVYVYVFCVCVCLCVYEFARKVRTQWITVPY